MGGYLGGDLGEGPPSNHLELEQVLSGLCWDEVLSYYSWVDEVSHGSRVNEGFHFDWVFLLYANWEGFSFTSEGRIKGGLFTSVFMYMVGHTVGS
jgi:hypothetical protein